jgi:hypothetical protein
MHLISIAADKTNQDASRLALKAMVIESEISAHHLSRNNIRVYRDNPSVWKLELASLNGKLDFYIACLKTSHNF